MSGSGGDPITGEAGITGEAHVVHIAVLFGFDGAVQKRIGECLGNCTDFRAIWCCGSGDELFHLKEWWLDEVEPKCDAKRSTLFIPQDDDFFYACELAQGIAERHGPNACRLMICTASAEGLAAKATQGFRLRTLKAKAEKQGLATSDFRLRTR